MNVREITLTRRSFITASVAAIGGLALFGCSSNDGKRATEAGHSEAGSSGSESPASASGTSGPSETEPEKPKGASGENATTNAELRDKYDLHMNVERFVDSDGGSVDEDAFLRR